MIMIGLLDYRIINIENDFLSANHLVGIYD